MLPPLRILSNIEESELFKGLELLDFKENNMVS